MSQLQNKQKTLTKPSKFSIDSKLVAGLAIVIVLVVLTIFTVFYKFQSTKVSKSNHLQHTDEVEKQNSEGHQLDVASKPLTPGKMSLKEESTLPYDIPQTERESLYLPSAQDIELTMALEKQNQKSMSVLITGSDALTEKQVEELAVSRKARNELAENSMTEENLLKITNEWIVSETKQITDLVVQDLDTLIAKINCVDMLTGNLGICTDLLSAFYRSYWGTQVNALLLELENGIVACENELADIADYNVNFISYRSKYEGCYLMDILGTGIDGSMLYLIRLFNAFFSAYRVIFREKTDVCGRWIKFECKFRMERKGITNSLELENALHVVNRRVSAIHPYITILNTKASNAKEKFDQYHAKIKACGLNPDSDDLSVDRSSDSVDIQELKQEYLKLTANKIAYEKRLHGCLDYQQKLLREQAELKAEVDKLNERFFEKEEELARMKPEMSSEKEEAFNKAINTLDEFLKPQENTHLERIHSRMVERLKQRFIAKNHYASSRILGTDFICRKVCAEFKKGIYKYVKADDNKCKDDGVESTEALLGVYYQGWVYKRDIETKVIYELGDEMMKLAKKAVIAFRKHKEEILMHNKRLVCLQYMEILFRRSFYEPTTIVELIRPEFIRECQEYLKWVDKVNMLLTISQEED